LLYSRNKVYSKRELVIRVLLTVVLLPLLVGVYFHAWSALPWAYLGLAVVWVADLAWLRSRGQIGGTADRFANPSQ
jgi:hypothetical protein